jgi:hypothetical protein
MRQAVQRHPSQMPAWLVFSGVLLGISGASLKKHADRVGDIVEALGSQAATSNLTAAAPGALGLGLLIAGALLALAGLVAIAARRPT